MLSSTTFLCTGCPQLCLQVSLIDDVNKQADQTRFDMTYPQTVDKNWLKNDRVIEGILPAFARYGRLSGLAGAVSLRAFFALRQLDQTRHA
jgi:hypothetical protein